MATIGITEFLNKKYDLLQFEGKWKDSFGIPERGFSVLIHGASFNGKTSFVVMFLKYMTNFGKCYFNSGEEEWGSSLQRALIHNDMHEVVGKVIFADGESFETMCNRLKKRNSPQIVFIDSAQKMRLTLTQWDEFRALFPRKIIIVISWEERREPVGAHAKGIKYYSDVKIRVVKFRAHVKSRFGGGKPFVIWENPTDFEEEQPQKVTKIRMRVAKEPTKIAQKSA